MTDDRAADFNLLQETGREAAKLALSYSGRSIVQERKSDGSAVTEADKAVDALLMERLRTARPHYGWLSEESAEHTERLIARRVWVLDPIDGTRAFIQGRDDWTVALALVEDGVPVLAVVINPVRGEVYEAQAGKGAFLNGRRVLGSSRTELSGARIALPEVGSKRWTPPKALPHLKPVFANSSIYRLALIASDNADIALAVKPKWEWDVAAGALLVSEAGCSISDISGLPLKFNSPEAKVQGFLAGPPKLHQMLVELWSGVPEGSAAAQRA